MNATPSEYTCLDYEMRWSVECLLSDFKSRGFGITESQMVRSEKLANLILVLCIKTFDTEY
ncbi:hypothetical protein SCG7086_AB_00020 [Chlamydiales bacterium SCGC AG-110-P3]|nr:hypothetical protein SCG7086_AB_00020 [Chlamydiales bacterium SCGC AG-110-P3]